MKTLTLFLCLVVTLSAKGTHSWRKGWPIPKLVYAPAGGPVPAGMIRTGCVPFTGSMRPYIKGGETLIVEGYYGQELHLGEVVATDVLHMIVDLDPASGEVLTSSTSVSRGLVGQHVFDRWGSTNRIRYIVRVVEGRKP